MSLCRVIPAMDRFCFVALLAAMFLLAVGCAVRDAPSELAPEADATSLEAPVEVLVALPKPTSRMIHRMQKTILSESAGWVLFSDGPNLVFANRGTSYRHVVIFVLGLITVILGANGIVWLVAGFRSGENSKLGIILFAVAGLAAFGVSRFWAAETRDQTVIPAPDTWVAVLDLETRTLETPDGELLAPLADVRFARVMQFGSSSRALSASWPGGSMVVYRGSPFAGSFRAALDALRRQGVETG